MLKVSKNFKQELENLSIAELLRHEYRKDNDGTPLEIIFGLGAFGAVFTLGGLFGILSFQFLGTFFFILGVCIFIFGIFCFFGMYKLSKEFSKVLHYDRYTIERVEQAIQERYNVAEVHTVTTVALGNLIEDPEDEDSEDTLKSFVRVRLSDRGTHDYDYTLNDHDEIELIARDEYALAPEMLLRASQ